MSTKIIVSCDGQDCCNEHVFNTVYFDPDDIVAAGWSHDADNDFEYCPSCKEKMIKSGELKI